MPNCCFELYVLENLIFFSIVFFKTPCTDGIWPANMEGLSLSQARRETGNVAATSSAGRQYATAADGVKTLSPAVMAVADFDPNIHVDNTKEGYASNNASPLKSSTPAKPRNGVFNHD